MKKNSRVLMCFITLVLMFSIFQPLSTKAFSTERDSKKDSLTLSSRDLGILKGLQTENQTLTLEDSTTEEKGLLSKASQSDNNQYNSNIDVIEEYEEDNNSLYVQIFENSTSEEISAHKVQSIEEVNEIEIVPPHEFVEENADEPYYSVSYSIVISSPKYTGVFDFDRFYINDLEEMSKEDISQVLEYNKINNLDKPLNVNFHENTNEITQLTEDYDASDYDATCIACIGYIPQTPVYESKWTDVAQVHAIKGVRTTFTLSQGKSSKTSIQVKTVFPKGSAEVSGSRSITFSDIAEYPTIEGTSLTSAGKYAQTKIKYAKQKYIHPNGNHYTKVSAKNFIGGTNWGRSVGGNGKSYYSVDGPEYMPNSKYTIKQEKSVSFTGAATFSIYDQSIGLTNTTSTSLKNTWHFAFLSGKGYKQYKIYNKGTKNNLTAR